MNKEFEMLKPKIEEVINATPRELKTAHLPTKDGSYYAAAFWVIRLQTSNDTLMEFLHERGIEKTSSLEKEIKQYCRAFRFAQGLLSLEYEWTGFLDYWEVPPHRRKGTYRVCRFPPGTTLWEEVRDSPDTGFWRPRRTYLSTKNSITPTDEVLEF